MGVEISLSLREGDEYIPSIDLEEPSIGDPRNDAAAAAAADDDDDDDDDAPLEDELRAAAPGARIDVFMTISYPQLIPTGLVCCKWDVSVWDSITLLHPPPPPPSRSLFSHRSEPSTSASPVLSVLPLLFPFLPFPFFLFFPFLPFPFFLFFPFLPLMNYLSDELIVSRCSCSCHPPPSLPSSLTHL